MFGIGQNLFYPGQPDPNASWGMQGNWYYPYQGNMSGGEYTHGATGTLAMQMHNYGQQHMQHTGCQPVQVSPEFSSSSVPVPTQGTTGPEQQHASRVQQVLDMIASLSDAEKTEVWSSSPNARGMPGDFENIVRALLNSVVSLDHLDENDLRVVADSLIDSLSRLCQGVDLHPFVTQAMHRGIEEGRVDCNESG